MDGGAFVHPDGWLCLCRATSLQVLPACALVYNHEGGGDRLVLGGVNVSTRT